MARKYIKQAVSSIACALGLASPGPVFFHTLRDLLALLLRHRFSAATLGDWEGTSTLKLF